MKQNKIDRLVAASQNISEKNYWLRKLSGELPGSFFPGNYSKEHLTKDSAAEQRDRFRYIFSEDLSRRIMEASNDSDHSLHIILLAGFVVLLHKYSGDEDIICGSPVYRQDSKEELLNTVLPLRNNAAHDMTFKELIFRVRQSLIEATEHYAYPVELLLEHLDLPGSGNYFPLFDTAVLLRNIHDEEDIRYINPAVILSFERKGKILESTLEFPVSRCSETMVRRILSHLENIMDSALRNTGSPLSALDILNREEKQQLLKDFNDTAFQFPPVEVIHELFEQQVERSPDTIAVVGTESGGVPAGEASESCLSYLELNERANSLAHLLRSKGIKPGDMIAFTAVRSLESIAGIFAILKAGAAYLPLDPVFPGERIKFLLKDSGAVLLLTFRHPVPDDCSDICEILDCSKLDIASGNRQNHPNLTRSSDTGYVLYTSGSTGRPKGVIVEHHSIVNIIFVLFREYPFDQRDVYLLKTSFLFDVSVSELFGWFPGGGRLALLEPGAEKDPRKISGAVKHFAVTHMNFVPSMFNAFIDALHDQNILDLYSLKYIFLAGEELLPEMVARFRKLNSTIELENIYGPTEAAVYASQYSLRDWAGYDNIPIGRPLPNVKLYILDKNNNLLPVGAAGELCISGSGVARGYLNRPGLTAKIFISNPFEEGELLYKTGDLVRWNEDGEIEFLGRMDQQLKIRGFRIELGEIEKQLLGFRPVKEAILSVSGEMSADRSLTAYIIPDKTGYRFSDEQLAADIREYLKENLPGFMIPSSLILLDRFPLNKSGKIDRKALAELGKRMKTGEKDYAPPETELERKVVDIWSDVLNIDKIGVNDNFFDLGGHSLDMVKVNLQLRDIFQVDITVAEMFDYPTVATLVEYLHDENQADNLLSREPGRPGSLAADTGKMGMAGKPGKSAGIAVIGMAGRFPGAGNIADYLENLKKGNEAISFFNDEELRRSGVAAGLLENPAYVRARGVLQGADSFDALFFNYTPKEAEVMDPQIRIFHECAYEALEDSGYNPDTYPGLIGVYAGASAHFYWQARAFLSGDTDWAAFQLTNKDYMSTRISYKLNLKGESSFIQTACSTSLVAVHHACRALHAGECHMALAGGITVLMPQENGYLFEEGMVASPDGHCRAFDAEARGTVWGNGVGVVVLKPLEEALIDGDHIYAVVKGSAVNNDGSRKVGYTAPGVSGQVRVIRDALMRSGIQPETIGYIETHGTGTTLGDPVEIEALKQAFNTGKRGFCRIGSVKTSIGHLDSAAGIAGFIKTVLALKHRLIPPSLNFRTPNPAIDFDNSPFIVNRELLPWEEGEYPRRAGVSSLGIGGTNAHIVLEEYKPEIRNRVVSNPKQIQNSNDQNKTLSSKEEWTGNQGAFLKNRPLDPQKTFDDGHNSEIPSHGGGPRSGGVGLSSPPQLILLSAKTPAALEKMTANLTSHLEGNPDVNLADAAYTLQVGRKAFSNKRMFVCSGVEEALRKLTAPGAPVHETVTLKKENPAVVFMFSGQGSQYVNMALELYRKEPVFRQEMDRCFEILAGIMDDDIKEIIYPEVVGEDAKEKVNDVIFSGPVKFIVEYSMAKLTMSLGIKPYAMIGHSFGEYAAACLSGVFPLEDALKLVVKRGLLMGKTPAGAMLGVTLPEEELKLLLPETISLAAVNTPTHCIVSGLQEDIEEFEKSLKEKGCDCLRVNYPRASHSKVMSSAAREFREYVSKVTFGRPAIPYISGLTGNWIGAEEAVDPGYWARHLTDTIRFSAGVNVLLQEPGALFLQMGSDRGLPLFVGFHSGGKEGAGALNLIRHPRKEVPDTYYFLKKIGQMWLRGVDIDWQALYRAERSATGAGMEFSLKSREKRYRVSLPTYPFESMSFRRDTNLARLVEQLLPGKLSLGREEDISNWFYIPSWELTVLPSYDGEDFVPPAGCVIFADELNLGKRLSERLQNGDNPVIVVNRGSRFKKTAGGVFTVNPFSRQDYDELVAELSGGNVPIKHIIHLWSISKDTRDPLSPEGLKEALYLGFYSLVFLIRALHNKKLTGEPIRLSVVSNHIHEVRGDESLSPAKAAVLGALRDIPLEFPEIDCMNIDIEFPPSSPEKEERVAAQILSELAVQAGRPHDVIAYRGKQRWAQSFKTMPLSAAAGDTPCLKERGVYLITGGLGDHGGIGYILAGYLTDQFKAKLVLISRRELPPRNRWKKYLKENTEEARICRVISRIMDLEERGAEVFAVSADVSDYKQMSRAVLRAEKRFGSIDGVIHNAAIMKGKSMSYISENVDISEYEKQFAAKIYGLLNVHKCFKDRELDFCLAASSIASFIGPFPAYSAANNFMDAFVQGLNHEGKTKWISVNWDNWYRLEESPAEVAKLAMTPEEGVETFRRILSLTGVNRVITSVIDFNRRINDLKKEEEITADPFEKKADMADWFYKPSWKRRDLPVETGENDAGAGAKNWLLFTKPSSFSTQVMDILRQRGFNVTIVYPGAAFERVKNREYRVNPAESDNYRRLFEELEKTGNLPGNVLHMWNVTPAGLDMSPGKKMATLQNLGLYSLMNIARAIGGSGMNDPLRMGILSSDMQRVTGEETLCPGKATLLGPCKIIPLEYANIDCRSIDIDCPPDEKTGGEKTAEQVVSEFSTGFSKEPVVAYRDNHRFVQEFAAVRIEQTALVKQRLKNKGVYFITGGMGGMGFYLARHLAAKWQARLVLVDIVDFPLREAWQRSATAAHDATKRYSSQEESSHENKISKDNSLEGSATVAVGDEETAWKIREIVQLEEKGAEFLIEKADVSDHKQMETVFIKAKERFGRIDGIIHSAGVIDYGGVIQNRKHEETESLLSAKVTGTLVLDKLSAGLGLNLDFLVLFSSIGNVIYKIKFGQVGYNAANEFLDAFAQSKQGRETFTAAIDWNDWTRVGMAVAAAKRKGEGEVGSLEDDLLSISPEEGIAVFELIIGSSAGQVVVSSYDLNLMVEHMQSPGERDSGRQAGFNKPGAAVLIARPDISSEYAHPRNETQQRLVHIWQDFFGIDRPGIDDDFFELGGDSLKAIYLLSKIHKEFDKQIPLARLFANPTIRGLAPLIEGGDREKFIPIRPVEKKEYYLLPSAQRRLHILQQMDVNSINFNDLVIRVLNTKIDREKCERAVKKIINRHESLRTSFHMVDERPVKRVHRPGDVTFTVEFFEFPHEDPAKIENVIVNFIRPFDLAHAPLIRILLIDIAGNRSILIMDIHHIITDATSNDLIVKEFINLYEGLALPVRRLHYKDYAEWQNGDEQNRFIQKQEDFWMEMFAGDIPVIHLPYDFPRPRLHSFAGSAILFALPKERGKALLQLAQSRDMTTFMVLIAIFNIFLTKITNQDDIVIGVATAGRRHADVADMIGIFVNLLAFRNPLSADRTFAGFLDGVKERTIKIFENRDYPFESLVEKVVSTRDISRSPVFDVCFHYLNLSEKKPGKEEENEASFTSTPYSRIVNRKARYDLTFIVQEDGDDFFLSFEYCTKLFKEETIKRFISYLLKVTEEVLDNPGKYIRDIEIIPRDEKEQVLYEFNNTAAGYPEDKVIHKLFEEQVTKTPHRIALALGRSRLTYVELNRRSNRLAIILRERGIKTNMIVGVMLDRSVEMVVSILAILKAGGAYLPVDHRYPDDRIYYILEDSKVSTILTGSREIEELNYTALQGLQHCGSRVYLTPPRPQITDLNGLPVPDRSTVDYEKYNRFIGLTLAKNSIAVQGTRGCPYNCAYCHKIWPKSHILRSAENIFKEIKSYYDMGVRRFSLIDDIFNLDKKNSTALFKLIIDNGLDIQLFFPNGVRGDILTKDYIDLMVKAGTASIGLALESASPRIQKLIRKNLNLKKLRENIEYLCEKHPGVILELFMMHGFPSETEEEAIMTLDFLKQFKWIHFPYFHILKIYPNTDMEKIALNKGISKKAILRSANIAFHELPETLPFERSFSQRLQADFFNDYFLNKERLLHVLPHQMKVLTDDEIVQKYDSYLPIEIGNFNDFLDFAGIKREELLAVNFVDDSAFRVPGLHGKMKRLFKQEAPADGALNVLLLDLSQLFSEESDMLYDVVEPPLGLMYVLTYLKKEFGTKVRGKIAKSRIDFNNYREFAELLAQFKPDVIGIRTLTFYKDFFHRTVSVLREAGFTGPVIAGGPYATSDYNTILQDRNVDLVVLGEGEITFSRLIGRILENEGKLPAEESLKETAGIAFIPGEAKRNNVFAREVVSLDKLAEKKTAAATNNPEAVNTPHDLSYVIYTSGTSGRPKGALIEHRNVVRLMFNDKFPFNFNHNDVWTMFHSYCFDFSVWEMYGALLYGGMLILVPAITAQDTGKYLELLSSEGVTVLNQTPSAFYNLASIETFSAEKRLKLKCVIFGGEALNFAKLSKWYRKYPETKLVNMFGITETTVHVTYKEIGMAEIEANTNNLGKPIPTLTTYVVDDHLNLLPVGIAGELCVGGDGVGRGYLNMLELNRQKFVGHPYRQDGNCYRSGDRVRFLANGELEYLGRIDEQVKIRGFRVEPGEIENHLTNHKDIKDALVIVKEDKPGEKSLCAYFITENDLPISDIRGYLGMLVPDYMVPAFFVKIEKFPLTANGKVDKKALPGVNYVREHGYVGPRDIIEKQLVDIWAEILAVDKEVVGLDANFFELGGHSLKLTILMSRVHKRFKVKIPMVEIFKRQKLKDLSEFIKGAVKEEFTAIVPAEKKEYYPLSSGQKRLYLLQTITPKSINYNVPLMYHLDIDPDETMLRDVFKKLMIRHETLRLSFKVLNKTPMQIINEAVDFEIPVFRAAGQAEIQPIIDNFIQPFDFGRAPFFRVGLIKAGDVGVLMFDMHHIISDGASHQIFEKEFMALYNGEELPVQRLQYKDYSQWQNSEVYRKVVKKQEEYWLEIFSDGVPVLNLPTDFPRDKALRFEGERVYFRLSKEQAAGLRRLSREEDCTLFMVVLSVFYVLMAGLSGQEDIIIGTPVLGRRHADLQHIIGLFVNMLALRNYPSADMSFREFLRQLKERSLTAFENQDYPFEKLVEKVRADRDETRNPLFDVIIAYDNFAYDPVEEFAFTEMGEKKHPFEYRNRTSKYDLLLNVFEGETLFFLIEYNKGLYKGETIERMAEDYIAVVDAVIGDKNIIVKNIITESTTWDSENVFSKVELNF